MKTWNHRWHARFAWTRRARWCSCLVAIWWPVLTVPSPSKTALSAGPTSRALSGLTCFEMQNVSRLTCDCLQLYIPSHTLCSASDTLSLLLLFLHHMDIRNVALFSQQCPFCLRFSFFVCDLYVCPARARFPDAQNLAFFFFFPAIPGFAISHVGSIQVQTLEKHDCSEVKEVENSCCVKIKKERKEIKTFWHVKHAVMYSVTGRNAMFEQSIFSKRSLGNPQFEKGYQRKKLGWTFTNMWIDLAVLLNSKHQFIAAFWVGRVQEGKAWSVCAGLWEVARAPQRCCAQAVTLDVKK